MSILLILTLIFGCYAAFSLIAKRFANPYRLYLVFGKKGSGKTTFLIKQAIHYLNRGWTVYTNINDMFVPGVRHVSDAEMMQLGHKSPPANTVLLIDEINLLWDNRNFKSFDQQTSRWFRLQRHYKVYTFCASQTYDCDKKIRDQVDGMYLCTCYKNVLSIARTIVKKPVVTVSTSEAESRISEDLKMLPFWSWRYTFIPRYARYFDSFAAPELPDFKYTADEIDLSGRKQFRRLRRYFRRLDKLQAAREEIGERSGSDEQP